MSLRARLLLGALVIAIVLVVSAAVIARSTRSHLVAQVDAQLEDAVPRLRGGPGQEGDGAFPGPPRP